jgi:hypothetical protein
MRKLLLLKKCYMTVLYLFVQGGDIDVGIKADHDK